MRDERYTDASDNDYLSSAGAGKVWLDDITSVSNEKVKLFQSLKVKKKRDRMQLVLVEGARACGDALRGGLVPRFVLLTREFAAKKQGAELLRMTAAVRSGANDHPSYINNGGIPVHTGNTTAATTTKPDSNSISKAVSSATMSVSPEAMQTETHFVSDAVLRAVTDTVSGQGVVAAFHKPHFDIIRFLSSEGSAAAIPGASRSKMCSSSSSSSSSSSLSRSSSSIVRGSSGDSGGSSGMESRGGIIAVLDGVQDPGNMGSLLRSSYALGVRAVVCINNCCDVWSPKVLRAACGLQLGALPVVALSTVAVGGDTTSINSSDYTVTFSEFLSAYKATVLAADADADADAANGYTMPPQILITDVKEVENGRESSCNGLDNDNFGGSGSDSNTDSIGDSVAYDLVDYVSGSSLLVLGSEGGGVRVETKLLLQRVFADYRRSGGSAGCAVRRIHIPMHCGVESFNVAVAGSIILAEAHRQQRQQRQQQR